MPISPFPPAELRGVAAPIRVLIRAALAAQGRRAGEIAVMLLRDADLRALNREWRCIDRATDVLSFSYDETGPGETLKPAGTRRSRRDRGRAVAATGAARTGRRVNGDLAISLDRMREQAHRYRVTPGRELARLVIHGALHLAGLDHQRPAERRHMRVHEDAVIESQRGAVRALDRALERGSRAARSAS